MSNNSHEIITEAKPHTIKKFELSEWYVDEWRYKLLENVIAADWFLLTVCAIQGSIMTKVKIS